MLRLLLRADELAVRALKVALDGVVLEVVDGLGFVLDVVVARGRRRGGSRRLVLGERGAPAQPPEPSLREERNR